MNADLSATAHALLFSRAIEYTLPPGPPPRFMFPRRTLLLCGVSPPLAHVWVPEAPPPLLPPKINYQAPSPRPIAASAAAPDDRVQFEHCPRGIEIF